MPFALLLAFAASVGVHLGVLFGPDIHLGWPDNPEPAPLQATLKRPPRTLPVPPSAAAKPAKPAHPKPDSPPPARPRPVPQVAASVPATIPPSSAAPDAVPAEAAAAAPESPPPAAEMAPLRGKSRFKICKGTQGFEIGQGEHVFEIAEGRYRIRTHAETTGLVALFKSLRVDQDSAGRLDQQGLVPERFTTVRDGVNSDEDAEFDWTNGKIRLGKEIGKPDSGRELHPGAQDLASFLYQLGYLGARVDGTRMGVTTGKYYEQFRFAVVGEEMLETAAGTFLTLRLHVSGKQTLDVWLAVERQWVPVKVRFTDPNGDVFEQILTELRLEP